MTGLQRELFEGPAAVAEATVRLASMHERAAKVGPHVLDEVEILEWLLQRCDAPGAPAPLALGLIRRFGSLPGVLGASAAEVAALTGEPVALELKLFHDLTLRILVFPLHRRCVLSSWSAVQAYLKASLRGRTREAFRVLFLDKANQLIADELMGEGTIDHAPVYPREVMRRALELAASGCCLVHNHPTGSATPSKADIEMTRLIVEAGRPLGVAIHDHFLVAGDKVVSFRGLGLM